MIELSTSANLIIATITFVLIICMGYFDYRDVAEKSKRPLIERLCWEIVESALILIFLVSFVSLIR